MSVLFSPLRLCQFLVANLILCGFAQAQYGITPLRGNLSDKPFCQTSLGRETHRFASDQVNAYRLYDFYQRQARYALEHPEDRAPLLPFPGLDGGRQGHWGITNEKSAEAMTRQKSEILSSFTERCESDLQAIRSGTADHPAAFAFDRKGNLREVLLDAKIQAPGIQFLLRQTVDTLGMTLQTTGTLFLVGSSPEWTTKEQQGARFGGLYWHGDKVIYRKFLGKGIILDHPRIDYTNDIALCSREFEWMEASETATYRFPKAKGIQPEKTTVTSLGPLAWRLSTPAEKGFLHHIVRLISEHTTSAAITNDHTGVEISTPQAGDILSVTSWIDADPEGRATLANLPAASKPSLLTKGGPTRFPQELRTAIHRDADPALQGSAYALDDIDLPWENPWNAPMNVSGITFDAEGTCYLCTLTGDVWRVTGLHQGNEVSWKRYAHGLCQPMGITITKGKICLSTAGHILRLHDEDGNNEADFAEVIHRAELPSGNLRNNGLEVDAAGNFHYANVSGIYRLSADGNKVEAIGKNTRNPLGFGMLPNGVCFSDCSEGDNENGTCAICESQHSDNANLKDARKRILYLPRGLDSSPGSRLALQEPRFGPLGQGIIGLSYSASSHYLILRDAVDGVPQAAMMPLPGDFASGVMRLAVNPADGQLYMAGIDGWGDYAIAEGSWHRIRWNGKPALLPQTWRAHKNGIHLQFNEAIDAGTLKPEAFFIQQWNNIDSLHTYGSADYSVRSPDSIGHDRLVVKSIVHKAGSREIFLEIPDLLPAMCTHIHGTIASTSGLHLNLDLFATINQLRENSSLAPAAPEPPQTTLLVPNKKSNGNTYQTIVEHFNQLAGIQSEKRPVAAAVSFKNDELNYAWIRDHLINVQCIMCHGAGTQHDFSSYKGLLSKVNIANPELSSLHGMIHSQSMPPYPLPSVAPSMQQAVLEWIRKGAPE